MKKTIYSTLLLAATLSLADFGGCCAIRTPQSGLEGTWALVPANPLPFLSKSEITFDCRGTMTLVMFTFSDGNTLTWHSPSNETTVDGDQVHISVTQDAMGFNFDGTLDSTSTPSQATGKLDLNLNFGNVTLSLQQGNATLVKQ